MKTITLKIYEMMGIREPFMQYHVGLEMISYADNLHNFILQ